MFLPILTLREVARFYNRPSTLHDADLELEETYFSACPTIDLTLAPADVDETPGFAEAA